MVSCLMRYALSLSSGASGSASRTALRPATDFLVKCSTASCRPRSRMALRPRSLKPSTSLAMPSRRRALVSLLRAGFSVSIAGIEYLSQVVHARVVPRSLQPSLQVHQATGVARDKGVRTALLQSLYLLVGHRGRDVGHLYGKGSPESAAELFVLPNEKLQPLDVLEQLPRLLQDPELSPLVAPAVKDHPPLVAGAEVTHP